MDVSPALLLRPHKKSRVPLIIAFACSCVQSSQGERGQDVRCVYAGLLGFAL